LKRTREQLAATAPRVNAALPHPGGIQYQVPYQIPIKNEGSNEPQLGGPAPPPPPQSGAPGRLSPSVEHAAEWLKKQRRHEDDVGNPTLIMSSATTNGTTSGLPMNFPAAAPAPLGNLGDGGVGGDGMLAPPPLPAHPDPNQNLDMGQHVNYNPVEQNYASALSEEWRVQENQQNQQQYGMNEISPEEVSHGALNITEL